MTVRLYARRSSSNSQKVLWFLGEIGLDYEFIPTGGDAGGLDTREYLAMNPNGKVPLLVDDEAVIWESHSILRYLAAEYSDQGYWPELAIDRSHFDRWMDWSQSGFDPAFMALFWGHYRTPQEQRNQTRNLQRRDECARLLQVLDGVLVQERFIGGSQPCLADIVIGALMYRYVELDYTLPPPVNVLAWYRQLQQRPAYQEHVMLPFAELEGRLAF